MTPATPINIFSSGSQAESWLVQNCFECTKHKTCELFKSMGEGSMKDGAIPFEVVERIGYKSLKGVDKHLYAVLGDCKEKKESGWLRLVNKIIERFGIRSLLESKSLDSKQILIVKRVKK